LWTGNLNFDIIGWGDSEDPDNDAPTIMTPSVPHFTIADTEITTLWMAHYWDRISSPIYIPARTKFTIRSTFNATNEPDTESQHGTGNLVLRGVPS
jgi:hypothetical protein